MRVRGIRVVMAATNVMMVRVVMVVVVFGHILLGFVVIFNHNAPAHVWNKMTLWGVTKRDGEGRKIFLAKVRVVL
jgi:hypothetical protein